MNTSSLLPSKNYSKVLFGEIEEARKKRVRVAAAKVAKHVNDAEERFESAKREAKRAAKLLKKMEKALKKYRKTGDEKYLEIFGV